MQGRLLASFALGASLWLGSSVQAFAANPPQPTATGAILPALTHATAFTFPEPVRLLYALDGEVKKFSYQAQGELLWKQDGHHYEARLQVGVPLLGERTRSSTGSITPVGLAPLRFVDTWRKEVAADFDQANHRASFSGNNPEVALETAAQDQLSVILQITGMLAATPSHYPPGTTLALQTIGLHGAEVWVFTVDGAEKVHLPNDTLGHMGTMDSLRLTRTPRLPSGQKVELWLSPSMGYLPVRLKITQASGDFIDQRLRGVETP
ncbi:DUF3108 domain-containing protein [Rhodoferax sp.]|uniref:DUF3108 domain-containing protein n=1 Tax=Rhodoferax sp. TaxID=50421 RepID=UPI0025D9AA19|nr:DUF3108 domain-containing protein [Rhodoferax sp.]